MLKTLVPAACVLLSLAACAPTPTRPIQTANSPPAGCVQSGSRIDTKNNDCVGFGQSYTQQDIQRTGGGDTGQALRLLDPSLIVHGH